MHYPIRHSIRISRVNFDRLKMLNKTVKIVEVGPRDGLQNETSLINTETKIELISRLCDAGLRYIEATSFVSPHWVPQMSDAVEVMQALPNRNDVNFSALVPNLRGLQKAISVDTKEIAVFTAASETFCQKNINCSIEESLTRFAEIVSQATLKGIKVRAYVSTIFECPYQDDVSIKKVIDISNALIEMGCYEISLGDTTGVGTPNQVRALLSPLLEEIPREKLAVHFHDTYGQAIANICEALELGVLGIDSSVAGLGGCPYAKGASGNVATEDVVYLLEGLGVATDIDLHKLVAIGHWISTHLRRKNTSKVGLAMNMRR